MNEYEGLWVDWQVKLWGESIDADKATKLPMPQESDDKDHAILATSTVTAVSTATPAPTSSSASDAKPTGTSSAAGGSSDDPTSTDAAEHADKMQQQNIKL